MKINKFFALLASLIATCAIITQFYLSIIIFNNDYVCRDVFNGANSSIDNKMNCENSLNNFNGSHCKCQYFWRYSCYFDGGTCSYDNDIIINYYVKVYDDTAVVLASFIFILQFIVQFVYNVYGLIALDFFELSCCRFPKTFNKIINIIWKSFTLVSTILTIGLIFRYCLISEIYYYELFIIFALICNCSNGICDIINIYLIYRYANNEKKYNEFVNIELK